MAARVRGRILNCDESPDKDDDWGIAHARGAGLLAARRAVPDRRDLRADWWSVGNQGSTGSCVGWAVADGVVRWHLVKAGRLEHRTRLSVRFAWMAAKETDEWSSSPTTFIEQEGTSIKAALDVARRFGAVTDRVIPFRSGRLYQGDPLTFLAKASTLKIRNYFGLHTPGEDWRWWLATNGPLVVRLEVDKAFSDATRGSAVLRRHGSGTGYGAHAVAVVGYRPDAFLVRNSWGRSWGASGFAWMTDAYAKAAVDEAYAITV